MSVQAISWAIETAAPSATAKLVLICLANYAGKDGEAHPGQQRLAQDTGLSDRSVRTACKALEEAGLIVREHRQRSDGSRTSDRYFLQLSNRKDLPDDEESNRKNLSIQPEGASGQYIANAISEPSEEPSDARASDPQSEFDVFWAQYPRKVAKPPALKAFSKARKANSFEAIMAGVAKHTAAWDASGTEKQFIPHPATFLNNERFNDEPEQPGPPGKGNPVRLTAAQQRDAEYRKFQESVGERFGANGDGEMPKDAFGFGGSNGAIRENVSVGGKFPH